MPEITIDTSMLSEDQVAALQGYATRRAERVTVKRGRETVSVTRKAARLYEEAGYAIEGDRDSEERAAAHLAVQGEKGYLGTAAVGGYSAPTSRIEDVSVQTIEHALRTNPSLTRAVAEQLSQGLAVFPATRDAQAAERNATEDAEREAAGKAKRESRSSGDQVSQSEPLTDEELADDKTTVAQLEAEAERLGVAKSGNKAELLERIQAARADAG